MPSLLLDTAARLAIVSVITESPETVSVITLPSGHQLRLFCHAGHVAIELVSNDLFDEAVDVSMQVLENLQRNRNWQ
jgi:hypothetical protein